MLVLVFTGQAMGQAKVLGGFQLGKITYNELKANLPKEVEITSDTGKPGESGGPILSTSGIGYGIEGLKWVDFSFDKTHTLAEVQICLKEQRFKDIEKTISSKYQPIRSQHPDAFRLFKANHDFVKLYFPWDTSFMVEYLNNAAYRRHESAIRQTIEYKKAEERRNREALEREAKEEAAKF